MNPKFIVVLIDGKAIMGECEDYTPHGYLILKNSDFIKLRNPLFLHVEYNRSLQGSSCHFEHLDCVARPKFATLKRLVLYCPSDEQVSMYKKYLKDNKYEP